MPAVITRSWIRAMMPDSAIFHSKKIARYTITSATKMIRPVIAFWVISWPQEPDTG